MTEDTKENFCPTCIVVPLALTGVGVSGVGAQQKGKHKKTANILLGVGLTTVAISIGIFIYYKYFKKCNECK